MARRDPSDPRRDRPRWVDRQRGPTRALGPRAAEYVASTSQLDRRARYRQRQAEVADAVARDQRRSMVLRAAAWAGASGSALAVGIAAAGSAGALGALGATVAAALIGLGLRRRARGRGAAAWDWQTQRYRLLSRPADRVRALDRGEQRPPWHAATRRERRP